MKIVFFGTPEFAVTLLKAVMEAGHEIVAVVTAIDKPAGRGRQLHSSAVKTFASGHGLAILQPANLKDEAFIATLHALKADVFIVVAFRMLPESVWSMPPLGTYNVHASLLPKYRGAAPINWAIINGESETGVTVFRLSHAIDTGGILLQRRVAINNEWNAGALHDVLMQQGGEALVEALHMLQTSVQTGKPLPLRAQNDDAATHAPKLNKQNCRINWQSSVRDICNHVRGLSPLPGAYSLFSDGGAERVLRIFDCSEATMIGGHANGSVVAANGVLTVACSGGAVKVNELQLEGKRRMQTADFLRGYSFPADTVLR